jgi:hypothetical protein
MPVAYLQPSRTTHNEAGRVTQKPRKTIGI